MNITHCTDIKCHMDAQNLWLEALNPVGGMPKGGVACAPVAPSGTEPAVEKDTLAASWTSLQGEICPLYSSVNT